MLKEKKRKHIMNSFSWEEERLKLMTILVRLSGLQLVELWEPSSISFMEDLTTLFTAVCFKFLENPLVVRDKLLLEHISVLLGMTVKNYGQTLSKCCDRLKAYCMCNYCVSRCKFKTRSTCAAL